MGVSAPPLAWLEWTLEWGLLARALVLAVVGAILALSWLNLRALPGRGRRTILWTLRASLVFGLALVFLQPTWVSERVRAGGRVMAVLVDASDSMACAPDATSRWHRARALAQTLAKRGPVRLYTIGERLQAHQEGDLPDDPPRQQRTDLLGALAELADLKRPPGLGAVVVISDGLDNGPLQERLSNLAAGRVVDDETARVIGQLGVPVHGLFVDDPRPPRDLVVTAVRSSPYAFVRNLLPVTVQVELHGYQDRAESIEVVLRDNGRPVASERLALAGPVRRALKMEMQPQSTGPHVLSASIAALPDEVTAVNNDAHVLLQVVRDRTRVLHLAGHPSWDTRYLRSHLRGDRAIDLVSFYVMVGEGARLYVQAQDTTLIPFPTRELFEEVLDDFDLVIFHDFRFGAFGVERHLPLLDGYVRRGGALMIIGGHQSLSAGGYARTSLSSWLPVNLGPPLGGDTGYREEPFKPQLTPAGRTHPLTRLLPALDRTEALWSEIALPGHNSALTAREGATTLLQTPDGTPVLAVHEHGQGRVGVLGTDGLWRWAFPPGEVEDPAAVRAAYHRFIERLRGWLTHDPTWDALRVSAPVTAIDRGAHAPLTASATLPDGRPAEGLRLRWRLRALPGDRTEGDWLEVPGVTDTRGQLSWRWRADRAGPFRVEVAATIDDQEQRAVSAMAVRQTGPEGRRIRPDDTLLTALANVSGGQLYRSLPDGTLPMVASAHLPELTEKVRVELWSGAWVAVLLIGLLTLEWLLRRRWGLA